MSKLYLFQEKEMLNRLIVHCVCITRAALHCAYFKIEFIEIMCQLGFELEVLRLSVEKLRHKSLTYCFTSTITSPSLLKVHFKISTR